MDCHVSQEEKPLIVYRLCIKAKFLENKSFCSCVEPMCKQGLVLFRHVLCAERDNLEWRKNPLLYKCTDNNWVVNNWIGCKSLPNPGMENIWPSRDSWNATPIISHHWLCWLMIMGVVVQQDSKGHMFTIMSPLLFQGQTKCKVIHTVHSCVVCFPGVNRMHELWLELEQNIGRECFSFLLLTVVPISIGHSVHANNIVVGFPLTQWRLLFQWIQ